jgi:hypothetical protein
MTIAFGLAISPLTISSGVLRRRHGGPPDHVVKQIIIQAEEAGAETILVSMNRGAMPHEMFLNQIRRFGKEVLPHLQAHEITRVPAAEAGGLVLAP